MDPERMRAAVAEYVTALHRAYLATGRHVPARRAGRDAPAHRRPSAGRRRRGAQPAPARDAGRARAAAGPGGGGRRARCQGCEWTLRFYDPVVAPALGLIAEDDGPAYAEVRGALGVTTVVYHVVAQPGSGLTPHHAGHIGAGLAAGHTAAARDFETIRTRVRGREALVDELVGAAHAGLPRAQALLAQAIAPARSGRRGAGRVGVGGPRAPTPTRSAKRCWRRWAAAAAGPP